MRPLKMQIRKTNGDLLIMLTHTRPWNVSLFGQGPPLARHDQPFRSGNWGGGRTTSKGWWTAALILIK